MKIENQNIAQPTLLAALIHDVIANRRAIGEAPAALSDTLAADRLKYDELKCALDRCKERVLAMISEDRKTPQGALREVHALMDAADAITWFMAIRGFNYGMECNGENE